MLKILLVEDNELNQDSLKRILTKHGYEVLIAANGKIGVDMALAEDPDLILMDIGLPVMDGFEAISKIREAGSARPIIVVTATSDRIIKPPIIALTAHALQRDKELATQVGANEYETKPIDVKRLLEKIRHFLGQ